MREREREVRGLGGDEEENLKHIFTLSPPTCGTCNRECFLFIWLRRGRGGFSAVPSALSSRENRADPIIRRDTRSLENNNTFAATR